MLDENKFKPVGWPLCFAQHGPPKVDTKQRLAAAPLPLGNFAFDNDYSLVIASWTKYMHGYQCKI